MSKYFQYIGFTLPEESLVSRKALLSAATYVEDKLSRDVFTVARNDKDEHNLALYILALHNPDVLDVRIHFKNEVAFCDKSLGQKLHTRYMSIHRAYHEEHAISREEFIRQNGKLFGYSTESTQIFLDSGVPHSCGCRLCGGDVDGN